MNRKAQQRREAMQTEGSSVVGRNTHGQESSGQRSRFVRQGCFQAAAAEFEVVRGRVEREMSARLWIRGFDRRGIGRRVHTN